MHIINTDLSQCAYIFREPSRKINARRQILKRHKIAVCVCERELQHMRMRTSDSYHNRLCLPVLRRFHRKLAYIFSTYVYVYRESQNARIQQQTFERGAHNKQTTSNNTHNFTIEKHINSLILIISSHKNIDEAGCMARVWWYGWAKWALDLR